MDYESFMQRQVRNELAKSLVKQAPKKKALIKKALKNYDYNAPIKDTYKKPKEKPSKFVKNLKSGLSKVAKRTYEGKIKNRSITKSGPTPTVVISGEVYDKDRSRFFKEQWEEEKKQLYFK